MNQLKVSVVQSFIRWHKSEENYKNVESLISKIEDTDLIVLPEMWASGFTMHAHKYHGATRQAIDKMKAWSIEKKAGVIGSLITKVNEDYFNRLYLIENGSIKTTYDKKHLFAFSGEDKYFKSGNEKCIVSYKEWTLCLNVCYDLRFPVWVRNVEDYDALIFCANWPNKRIDAWDTLLKARAIENQCYVIGSNCYGEDVWRNHYDGHSGIYSYDGKQLQFLKGASGILETTLSKEGLAKFRNDIPFLKDRDKFQLL